MEKKQRLHINSQRQRRAARVRAKISGTSETPRLAIHRSLRYISAQIIDDTTSKTVASFHQKDLSGKFSKTDAAVEVGKAIAEKAKAAGIESVVFDRRHYKYHGRVKALAEAARENGLKF